MFRARISRMRLHLKRDFDRVFSQGRRMSFDVKGRKVRVVFLEGEKIRFAVVVSKKVSKKAVRRNRTKRLLREAFKNLLLCTQGKIPKGDFVFIPRADLSDLKMQDVLAGMCRFFWEFGKR